MRRRRGAGLATAGAALLALWLAHEPPRAPVPTLEPPPPEARTSPEPPARAEPHVAVSPAPPARRARRPQPAPEPPPAVRLEDLLRLPATPAGPQSREPPLAAPPAAAEAPARQRIRIDFSRDEPLAGAPLPRPWTRTEAGVSVPVDEAERIRVRGGVRVDARGAEEEAREVEATPSLGLELRF